jgi:hypothetical protein
MVKFRIRANPGGQYYFPKEVREELGKRLSLFCDAKAALVFSDQTSLSIVLESMDVIRKELEHRQRIHKGTAESSNRVS